MNSSRLSPDWRRMAARSPDENCLTSSSTTTTREPFVNTVWPLPRRPSQPASSKARLTSLLPTDGYSGKSYRTLSRGVKHFLTLVAAGLTSPTEGPWFDGQTVPARDVRWTSQQRAE